MASEAALLEPPAQERMGKKTTRKPAAPKVTAETMAAKQREISVSEFFAKNRHLLGFDNPRKALLTTVKEAVDNALDACEEAGILPDLLVEIRGGPPVRGGTEDKSGSAEKDDRDASGNGSAKQGRRGAAGADERYLVIVQDNGPGIVRKQIENIFGKLLYGSKFHRLKMSRGQQGIGISAAGMYGLITTGKPVKIITKTSPRKASHEVILKMDTSKNRADVVSETEHPEDDPLFPHGHGTRIEIELVGKYFKGDRSVDQYLQLTSIANPHARIVYRTPPTSAAPEGETITFERSVDELPAQPEEIKPHPHGIELGTLIGMLERTDEKHLGGFFANEFCRVGPKVAQEVCAQAGLTARSWVKHVGHHEAEKLYRALQNARVMGPPTNCLSPIGVKTMLKGLEQGLQPDFIAVSSRPPAVYRGRPFVIEVGVAYGGGLPADEPAKVYRFANRVPLQYQQSACSSFKAVTDVGWRLYGLEQPRGGVPTGPVVFMIHMASVWVPFTSESKEAIADYDEIRAEMDLALKDCGRKLRAFLNKRKAMRAAGERRNIFERYIGEVAKACESLTGTDAAQIYEALMEVAKKKTAQMEQVLDEEGHVVRAEARLARDEGVYVRENGGGAEGEAEAPSGDGEAAPARPRRAAARAGADAGQSSLFGEDEAPGEPGESAPKAAKKKKKVLKKVLKKKVKRGGG